MKSVLHRLLFVPGLLLRGIVLPIAWAGVLTFAATMLVGQLGPLLALATAVAWAVLIDRLRRRRARMILTYLQQAVSMNLPLGRVLASAAMSEAWVLRSRLRKLRDQLETGQPIDVALRRACPEVDDRTVELITAAQRVGRLRATLSWLTEQDQPDDTAAAQRTFVWVYPLTLAAIVLTLLLAFMWVLLPNFQIIMEDFGTTLPATTQSLADVGRAIGLTGTAFGYLMMTAAIWAIWLWATWMTFCPRWLTLGPLRAVTDRIVARLPVAGRVIADRNWRDITRLLESATAVGMSLPTAAVEAMQLRLNAVTRARLRRWWTHMQAGQPIDEAARRAKLPTLITGLLKTVQRSDQLPRAMRFAGQYYDQKFNRTAELVRGAMVPGVELLLGAVVAWFVIGLLMPIFSLIDHVSAAW